MRVETVLAKIKILVLTENLQIPSASSLFNAAFIAQQNVFF